MNEILGKAIKLRLRKAKGRRLLGKALDKAKRLAALKKRLAAAALRKKLAAAKAKAKKPTAKALISRLPVETKKALIKRAILKRPALKKKLVAAVLRKKLQARQAGTVYMPSSMRQTSPVPAVSPSPPPVPSPAEEPIPQEEALTPAQAVEQETMERPLEDGAEDEAE